MNNLVIIDGNSIAYRAFFALPLLKNKKGIYTNAIFGFLNMLIKICEQEKPTHLVVVFDFPLRKNFRTEMYEDYKATRKPMPDELRSQMPILKDLIRKMGISVYEEQGVEADDIVGTLAKKFDTNTLIITGDKDCLQLIDSTTSVLLMKKGLSIVDRFTNKNFKDVWGFEPINIIDLKAIMGDASDNIPGVVGIGEKGATELIIKYATLENIFENLDELKPRQVECLNNNKEIARLSKKLATIDVDVKIKADLTGFVFNLPLKDEIKEDFYELEFYSLLKNEKLFSKSEQSEKLQHETNVVISSKNSLKNLIEQFSIKTMCVVLEKNRIHICFDSVTNYEIKTVDNLLNDGIKIEDVVQILKPVLENNEIEKVCFDFKLLAHFFDKFGASLNGLSEDTQIAEWLVSPNIRKGGVDALLSDYENVNAVNLLIETNKFKSNRLNLSLNNLYYNIEIPCVKTLYTMEKNGVKLSFAELNSIHQLYADELKTIEDKIYLAAGERFNINSPKQVCEVLYDKLGLIKNEKKRSSDISVLNKYRNFEIVELLIEQRELFKLVSTYIIPLKEFAKNEGMVHSTFNITGTITGRLSSSNPNLQNLPTRTPKGKALRQAFISRFKNGKILSGDYNQIELRLLAHFSQDEKLISAYNNGEDIHSATACEIFGINKSDLTPEIRRSAKAVNFGIIYGISAYGLSEQLGISPVVAKEYIKRYFERFPKVKIYLDDCIANAQKNGGFVSTLFGRKREIPELFSSNFNLRSFGERVAMNFPLQGSASDIIKIAMINFQKELIERKLKSLLVLQIHDELVVDCAEDEVEIMAKLLKETMESVTTLNLPLVAIVETGEHL